MKNNFTFVVTKVENGYTKQFSVKKVAMGTHSSRLCYSNSVIAYQTNLLDMDKKCVKCLNNKAVKNRTKCACCAKKAQREKYPIKAAYYDLRTNAKRRDKEFTLTLDEFTQFCIETEYHLGKGKTANSYSIDRIDDEKGYHIDNIRVLTLSDNTHKENNRRKKVVCDWESGKRKEFYTVLEQNFLTTDCPF